MIEEHDKMPKAQVKVLNATTTTKNFIHHQNSNRSPIHFWFSSHLLSVKTVPSAIHSICNNCEKLFPYKTPSNQQHQTNIYTVYRGLYVWQTLFLSLPAFTFIIYPWPEDVFLKNSFTACFIWRITCARRAYDYYYRDLAEMTVRVE